MQILDNISKNPGIMKKDVAVSVGLSRTGGAWHVNKLAKKGIVREERVRGHCYLYPVPERVERVQALSRIHPPKMEDVPWEAPAPVEVDALGLEIPPPVDAATLRVVVPVPPAHDARARLVGPREPHALEPEIDGRTIT